MSFPKDFVWGAATSSYQIEGAASRDGGGASVWDMLCLQPGRIANGDTGEIACDHYRRYREDVGLMADMGLQAYRFSISWPRVLPEGAGTVNAKGLDFYSRLVDELLGHGITPWVTLFHWDYPYALYCRGGWLNRDSAGWFADYTALVVDRLSDRVAHWLTLNEPQCFIGMGHLDGTHAPALQMGVAEVLLAAHHALLAHGQAVQVIRARASTPPRVSAAQASPVSIPDTDASENIDAARNHMFAIREKGFFNNTWFSDPMLTGCYPEDGLALFEADMPAMQDGDLATIHQPLDFFGANIYSGRYVRATADGAFEQVTDRDPPWAGRSRPKPSTGLRGFSMNATACRSSSRKTVWRMTTVSRTAASTTSRVSIFYSPTCSTTPAPSPTACRPGAIFSGQSWTTSSGRRAMTSASG
jgi:beta-glucosidase